MSVSEEVAFLRRMVLCDKQPFIITVNINIQNNIQNLHHGDVYNTHNLFAEGGKKSKICRGPFYPWKKFLNRKNHLLMVLVEDNRKKKFEFFHKDVQ